MIQSPNHSLTGNYPRLTLSFITFFLIILLTSLGSCKKVHFLDSPSYREKIEIQFLKQKQLAKNREIALFKILDQDHITLEEKEALQFLFAHMPLNDLADYDGSLFLNYVRQSFQARDTLPWGKKIPPGIFRHFVLPYRVNNENLDHFRMLYFNELKERVKNLSMKEAALEVNHWCHEKVTYKSTDIRTSAPCSTIKTAYGRCGEESTFTVSALRMVAIPARQCYTPRWAHCDDNHAWVEVWIDGQWHYLGACEPEPQLDIAWFSEPARRAMLVHTKVFGLYEGPEEIVTQTPLFTEINIISNYTKTKKIDVIVKNRNHQPLANIPVQFCLYNYAEFYPLATQLTDLQGKCSLTTGLGDLLIWATDKEFYGFKKISVAGSDSIEITLDLLPGKEYSLDIDFAPPITPEPLPIPIQDKEKNTLRLKQEDQIRAQYEATFITQTATDTFAANLEFDPAETWPIMEKSRGNWKEIAYFLERADGLLKPYALPLLHVISEKDLRDTPAAILLGHLNRSFTHAQNLPQTHPELFVDYILNPRIDNEMISNYKFHLQQYFQPGFIQKVRQDPGKIVQWIRDHIAIHDTENYYRVPLTPVGTYQLRAADRHSRDIFFVALCRSFAIPARLEPASKRPQFFSIASNQWHDVQLENIDPTSTPTIPNGYITLTSTHSQSQLIPRYYSHFTLAHFLHGQFHTLEFPEDQPLTQFPNPLEIQTGYYLLVTGNRQTDGSVLCQLTFFNVAANPDKKNPPSPIPVKLRQSQTQPFIYGTIQLSTPIQSLENHQSLLLSELARDKKLIIGWLDPDKEPSKHVMAEIHQWKSTFEKSGCSFVFFIPKEKMTASFSPQNFAPLPQPYVFACDPGENFGHITNVLNLSNQEPLPIFIVADNQGRVTLITCGYRIGVGELLLKSVL